MTRAGRGGGGGIGEGGAASAATDRLGLFVVTDPEYGATGDGVTDDTAAVQAAITAINTAGRGILFFPAGTYVVGTGAVSITPPTVPCVIRGSGMGVTVIKWASTAHCFNTGSQARHSQSFLQFEDLTVEGKWAELLPSLPSFSPFQIYGTDELSFRRVELSNCSYFGFIVRNCERVIVTECRVYECARDAISCATCTYVTVTDNQIDHCDDDAITVHTQSDSSESVKQGVVISGNRLSDCGGGIAAFGGRRIAITGNEIERSRLRGIVVGVAASQPNISHAITISGNTITDVINRNTIDALSDGNRYITILSTVQAGTGIAVPGLPSGAGTFESMDAALLTNAAGGPLAPASWITVSGNVLARTLVAGGSYSSYGHGNMFTRNGYLNPTITEAMLSTTAVGVYAENGLRDSVIASNVIRGVNSGVLFGGAVNDLENVTIHGNVLVRFGSAGVAFDSAVTNGKNIEVSDNIFDGDPYHEHANRGSGGTWAASGAPVGVFVQNAKGVIARNNTFRRVCRLSDKLSNAGTDNALFSGNVYDCEPAALGFSTSNVGVGEIPRGSVKAIARIVDSNPTSATYGLTLNVCQTDKSSIPTTGAYVAGHFVHNNGASVLAPYGWQRATTGSNHVLGTDWVAIADPFLRPAVGSTLTIATGVVTATATVHAVDTEAAAATDDLDTINGLSSGQLLVLRAASGSRTIVAKDGTGNLRLAGDFSLDNADDRLVLISDGTNLLEVSRSDNAT